MHLQASRFYFMAADLFEKKKTDKSVDRIV